MALTKIGTTGISNNLDVPGYIYLSGDEKELRFYNGSNYMVLKASGSLSNNYTFTLPVDDGTTGQFLQTNGSGVLTWAAAGGDLSFGGDTFGADKVIGSNDNYDLSFETNGTTRINIDNGGITTFTAGGDESIRLAHASGITWSLQSRSDSEFRITDNNAGTTRLRVQAGTSGDTLVKDGGAYANVTRGIAKVWIRFSQTNSSHAMQENNGVGSITDGGAAGFTDFTWSRAFASEHYAILVSQEAMGIGYMEAASEAAGGVTIRFSNIDGGYTDALHGSVACFGDLS